MKATATSTAGSMTRSSAQDGSNANATSFIVYDHALPSPTQRKVYAAAHAKYRRALATKDMNVSLSDRSDRAGRDRAPVPSMTKSFELVGSVDRGTTRFAGGIEHLE